ncbi:MAG: AraC family transcriptional regulator [Bryobacterales bacterium]|nr:AraC family transcriptional regulator [Bryobacterales bacterium]
MDALSEVLKLVTLNGAIFYNAEFSCPWEFRSPRSQALLRHLQTAPGHVIIYHLVTQGTAWAFLERDPSARVELSAGQVVVFPHGDAHHMGNGSPAEIFDDEHHLADILSHGLAPACYGGGGEPTNFICGYFVCDPQLCRVVLGCLPPIFAVDLRADTAGRWLEESIRFSATRAASNEPGIHAVLAKLSELLFIETLRRHLGTMTAGDTGWLAGLRDPQVSQALAAIHREPARAWTIADLASGAGTSRSVLAERFRHYLGEPPMAYLMRWRLQLGAKLLGTTGRSVAEIAMQVGYDSEAAFNRAFKREFGEPPARYRKLREQEP